MSIYAIGDIHGCITALKTIFNQGFIKSDDTVVFLGDYVDRGINSKAVIYWLIEHQKNFNFEFILGNHEIMMLNARESQEKFLEWRKYGGAETLASYQIEEYSNWINKVDNSHWEFLEACREYLVIDNFIFVHAGLDANKSLEDQTQSDLCWKKHEIPTAYNSTNTVICGHTSRKNGKIADFGHTICIDTYAYGDKWLTCLNVETGEFLKANNDAEFKIGRLESFMK